MERMLPDGSIMFVYPFHVSLEGLESCILCRDDEDYDTMVKIIALAARRKNVIIIIYAVVSNHCHVAVLAATQEDADAFGDEIKKVYSMWFSSKYKERGKLKDVDVKALYLDNNWHTRNALAYIPRNALDNGCNVNEYKWSGYSAMFNSRKTPSGCRLVSQLSKREKRALMHTGDDLSNVGWLLDKQGRLVPESICDNNYLEQAFDNDQAFFLKTVGGQNSAEMKQKLVDLPRKMLPDTEFNKNVNDISRRWFGAELPQLTKEKKTRLLPYVFRTSKTTVSQLARAFELTREEVKEML
ncbi:MAG: transposase [Bacteroidales bacterium]|nr:transposase [Bacteroidales bacterium]